MSIGIYKIENLLNHKVYIGQSLHIEKRWQEHCRPSKNSVISNAIKKYGKNNFSFQIVEECDPSQLDEREVYYIQFYNSLTPNGYNIKTTLDNRVQVFKNYDIEVFGNIINDIKNSSLSFQEIADKYSLDLSMIYYLNHGTYHTIPGEVYPLRPVKDFSKKHWYCIDCGKEIAKGSTRCVECSRIASRKVDRPNRDELKNLIRCTPFTKIGEQYGVTDNAIRRWCKTYNLPFRTRDIKKCSDEDWSKI